MSNATVKLGLMPPLSGLVGIYGSEIVQAAQIACQEINENGGVLGKPLELIIEDDGSLPDSAVIAAKKLVEEYKCSAIIGNLLSNSRIAVAYQVAEPARTPLLNFSFYEGSILSRYFFHFAALPNQQIHQMIPYMAEKHGSKMFFAGNNYEWPRGSIDACKISLSEIGGEIVGEEYLPIGLNEKDIDELLDKVEAAAPDVFVPYFAGADQVLLLTRFTQRGMKKKIAVVMGHYDEMMASTLCPDVREGFYSSNTYFMTIGTESNQNYLSRLSQLPEVNGIWPDGNGVLTNFGEGAYLCVKAFAQAANSAGSLESEALIQSLKNITVTSPQGEVKMNPDHHHAKVNTYLSQCNKDGVFTIIENFGAIEPELPERYSHQRISHQATMEEDIRLQARMLEQLTEAVILISTTNNTILYVNAGAEQVFGYDKGMMIGLKLSQINSPDEQFPDNKISEIVQILNRKGTWEGEIKNVKKDGSPIWCWANISTFTHPVHGEVWLAVHHDITKSKLADVELKRYRENLEELVNERTKDLKEARDFAEEASRAKNEFLSRMSHELRTPMNAILGFAQILRMDKLEERQYGYVDEVLRGGEHLLNLINELLDLSRIETGKMEIVMKPVNVCNAVEYAVKSIHPLIDKMKLKVYNRCQPGTELLADTTRFNQILINILSNAAKYNRVGGRIDVTCEVVWENRLRISISDTGYGIDGQKKTDLFEPFNRLGAETSGIDGTGIGLALTRQLITLMGGEIFVDSVKGKGTTVSFELTLSKNKKHTVNKYESISNKKEAGRTVLYVEDNAANMRVVEAIIELQSDINLLSATNGEYGLELAKKYRPDLILLDIHLPKMSGYEILNELKADVLTKDIPVIALTADAMPLDIEKGLTAGFSQYITKPIKIDVLMKSIESLLSLKEASLDA